MPLYFYAIIWLLSEGNAILQYFGVQITSHVSNLLRLNDILQIISDSLYYFSDG